MTTRPRVSFVVAMDQDGAIGKGGDLPWKLPADMKRFRDLTLGGTVVMGRATYDSIGRPLNDRRNIVLSRTLERAEGDYELARSVDDVFALTPREKSIFIIGGAQIYAAFDPYVETVYATIVESYVNGDTFFPRLTRNTRRYGVGSHEIDEQHYARLRFETWQVGYPMGEGVTRRVLRAGGESETAGDASAVCGDPSASSI